MKKEEAKKYRAWISEIQKSLISYGWRLKGVFDGLVWANAMKMFKDGKTADEVAVHIDDNAPLGMAQGNN